MKHIILSNEWVFSMDPFAAYRCELTFGRNKRDRKFFPVRDVTPRVTYKTVAGYVERTLYRGFDKDAAEEIAAAHNAAAKEKNGYGDAEVKQSPPLLPEDNFRIARMSDGTFAAIGGEDTSNRCLLFVGGIGGFRGGVTIFTEGTSGKVLEVCSASNACESSVQAIVLLECGQSIAFHTFGRRTNEVYVYTWSGVEVEKKHFSKDEWDNHMSLEDTEYEEIL